MSASEVSPELSEEFPEPFMDKTSGSQRASPRYATSQTIFPEKSYKLSDGDERIKIYNAWKNVLRIYTNSELKFAKDRLVAIGGLATLWENILDNEYVAGLWRKDIPRQLFWVFRFESEDLSTDARLHNTKLVLG